MRPTVAGGEETMLEDLFPGDSEIAGRMRALDWSRTDLGHPESWSQTLRVAVSLCLSSRFPIVIYWGSEFVTLYNDAYAPILANKHPEALGQPCREVWAEIWDVIEPMLKGVVATGEATWSDDQLLILRRHAYLEECYFSFSFSPIRAEYGGVAGIFTAVIEHTQRVVGERRLEILRKLGAQAAETRTVEAACGAAAQVLEENPHDIPFAAIYLTDETGAGIRFCASAGLGEGAYPFPSSVSTSDSATSRWPLASVLRTRQAEEIPERNLLAAPIRGHLYPEPVRQAMVLPIPATTQERLAGLLVIGVSPRRVLDPAYHTFLDLVAGHIGTAIADAKAYEAERKRAEALAELDRAKTTFFSNVSHEFRTPLTLILGPLEDALAETTEPWQRDRLELLHRNALRLQKLVNTLLDFSRIEAGRVQAYYEPIDLAAFTSDLASVFRSVVEKAGMVLLVDCPPLSQPVFVDREMWEKIVLNLISNAFKFTLEGEIEVKLWDAGEAVRLSVRDTGSGIPEEHLGHLFERFHRVEGTRARTHEGTGIGLALVQELVKLHGGTVRVESVCGKGSTFTVTIPKGERHQPRDRIGTSRTLALTELTANHYLEETLRWLPDGVDGMHHVSSYVFQPSTAVDAPRLHPIEAERARIVWADDNADMRDYVRRLLSAHYDVEAVADGEMALASVRREIPDLVLADIMMPGLDGFGLLRAIRADKNTRTVPVILLSARAGEESRVEGLEAGADDYLIKPFSAKELLARVGSHLELARLRREAAETLRESEARFRNMADNSPVMIWVTGPFANATYLNEQWYKFTGTNSEQGLGFGWVECVHPDDREKSTAAFLAANERREPFRLEYRLKRHDGEYRWAIDSAVPRFGAESQFLGYIGSVIDISDLKRVETDLRETDRRKDEFLATLAHELRGPLAPLRNMLEIMKRADGNAELLRQARHTMERQLAQMVRLVDDLLDVSRISRGRIELKRERFELGSIINQAVEACRPLAEGSKHKVTVILPPEPIYLNTDPVRLAQVFGNLLNNSCKYTEPGGEIWLTAEFASGRRETPEVLVKVKDTGIGIPPDKLDGIFEMFAQVDPSLERSQGGLGIGLTLAKRLVEMHDGTVEAFSDGLGRGSTFMVRLPAEIEAPIAPQSTEPATQRQTTAARRILVVDDNPDSAASLAMLLKMTGHETHTANDGIEGVEAAEQLRPDVVLLDIGLPKLNGYEACRKIREQPWGKSMVVVALTGWGQEEDRRLSKEAGFDTHMVKPVDYPALMELLVSLGPREPGGPRGL